MLVLLQDTYFTLSSSVHVALLIQISNGKLRSHPSLMLSKSVTK